MKIHSLWYACLSLATPSSEGFVVSSNRGRIRLLSSHLRVRGGWDNDDFLSSLSRTTEVHDGDEDPWPDFSQQSEGQTTPSQPMSRQSQVMAQQQLMAQQAQQQQQQLTQPPIYPPQQQQTPPSASTNDAYVQQYAQANAAPPPPPQQQQSQPPPMTGNPYGQPAVPPPQNPPLGQPPTTAIPQQQRQPQSYAPPQLDAYGRPLAPPPVNPYSGQPLQPSYVPPPPQPTAPYQPQSYTTTPPPPPQPQVMPTPTTATADSPQPQQQDDELPAQDLPGTNAIAQETVEKIKRSHEAPEEESSQGGQMFRSLMARAAKQAQQQQPPPPPPTTNPATTTMTIPSNPAELSIEEQARLFRQLMAQSQSSSSQPPPRMAPPPATNAQQNNYLPHGVGHDGRKIGRNRDADIISTTADTYLAKLKQDSTSRNLARYAGDENTANSIFFDKERIEAIVDPEVNPYTMEQRQRERDMLETVPDEMLLFQEYSQQEKGQATKRLSYKEQLAQRQPKRTQQTEE